MTADAGWRPRMHWFDLLDAAPYFTQAIMPGARVTNDQLARAAALVRAVCYYDIFDGEVSNGGLMGYFYNKAHSLRDFTRAPEFVATHPLLADALPSMTAAHAAFAEVREEVEATRTADLDEDVSELFQRHRPRFASLERNFLAIKAALRMRLHRAIVQDPHAYLDIEPCEGVPATGTAHVLTRIEPRGLTCRLRFVDGFPIGPNIVEEREGRCRLVVRFAHDRDHVDVDRFDDGIDESRCWVDFKTGISETRRFEQGRLRLVEGKKLLWQAHGMRETYREDGSVENTDLKLGGKGIAAASYYPDGRLWFLQQSVDGQRRRRWWFPSGALNVEAIEEADLRIRYLGCWAEDGCSLAPDGNGLLRQLLPREEGVEERWREGRLVAGYLEGDAVWLENGKDVGKMTYRNGVLVQS
jgi:hypothetical protein